MRSELRLRSVRGVPVMALLLGASAHAAANTTGAIEPEEKIHRVAYGPVQYALTHTHGDGLRETHDCSAILAFDFALHGDAFSLLLRGAEDDFAFACALESIGIVSVATPVSGALKRDGDAFVFASSSESTGLSGHTVRTETRIAFTLRADAVELVWESADDDGSRALHLGGTLDNRFWLTSEVARLVDAYAERARACADDPIRCATDYAHTFVELAERCAASPETCLPDTGGLGV